MPMALEALKPKWPLDRIESVYAYAYEFYRTGHYNQSKDLFRLLTVVGPKIKSIGLVLGPVCSC